jgi:hypothetical protein
MNRDKKATISVQGTEVILLSHRKEDYISLTDMAKYKDSMEPSLVISHWMSTRYTIEFMGIWEQINNPDFKPTEFGRFRMEAGSNGFIMTPKRWMENTAGIGVFSKSGRYGGGTVSSISKRESKIGGVWRSQSVPTAEPIFKNVKINNL